MPASQIKHPTGSTVATELRACARPGPVRARWPGTTSKTSGCAKENFINFRLMSAMCAISLHLQVGAFKGRGLCRAVQGDPDWYAKLAQGAAPPRVTTPNDVDYVLNTKQQYCTGYFVI